MKTEKQEEVKNGIELLLSLQLTTELMDEYNLKGLGKRYANMFKGELEKTVSKAYDNVYASDPEMCINAINKKMYLISTLAKYNEADIMLLSSFIEKFDSNIEIARKKGVVFFDKLLK